MVKACLGWHNVPLQLNLLGLDLRTVIRLAGGEWRVRVIRLAVRLSKALLFSILRTSWIFRTVHIRVELLPVVLIGGQTTDILLVVLVVGDAQRGLFAHFTASARLSALILQFLRLAVVLILLFGL